MTGTYFSRHLWRNAGAVTVALAFSLGSHAVFFYILARFFCPADYGIVTMAFAMLFVGSTIVSLGSETYGVRLIAAGVGHSSPVADLLLTFQLLNAVAVTLAILSTVAFWTSSVMERGFISVMAISLIPDTISSVVGASFYGRERFIPYTALIVISSCAMVVVAVMAVMSGASILAIGAALLVLKSIIAVLAIGVHRRHAGPLRLVTPGLAYGSLARQSLPYFVISVLATIHMKVDIPMVRVMRGTAELGLYGLAAMVVNAAAAGIRPLSTPLFPAVAREGGVGAVLHPSRALRTLLIPLAAGIGAGIVIIVLAGPMISAFLGSEYAGSIQPLRILALFLPSVFVSSTAIRIMMACGKTQPVVRILAVNCVVNIVANLVLIPRAGINGAALSTVLSSAAGALQSVIFLTQLARSTREP